MDEEELNFYRLVKLLLEKGTKVAEECVQDNLSSEAQSIYFALDKFRQNIQRCRRNKFINENQFRLLYPISGVHADTSRFDLCLWFFLARNITSSKFTDAEWNKRDVRPDQVEWEHDLIRIREIRNELSHIPRPVLDSTSFQSIWTRLTSAIRRRDVTVDVDGYRNLTIDRDAMRIAELELKEQVMQDQVNFLNHEIQMKSCGNCLFIGLFVLMALVCVGVVLFFALSGIHNCENYIQFFPTGKIGVLKYLSRRAWGASSSRGATRPLGRNISVVALGHTAFVGLCYNLQYCCMEIREIQDLCFNSDNFTDIAYHFLIDSNGFVYEGVPLDEESSSINQWEFWEKTAYFIVLMGNFMFQQPTDIALASLDILLKNLTYNNDLFENFTLYPVCQLRPTQSPGINLYNKLMNPQFRYLYRVGNWTGNNVTRSFNCSFDSDL